MSLLRRLVGALVLLLSTAALVGCLAAVVGVWVGRQRASEEVQTASARLDAALGRASAAGEKVRGALEKARGQVAQVGARSAGLRGGGEKARAVTDLLRLAVRQEAGPRISEAGGRLDTFADAAVAVASLLESLQGFPLPGAGRVSPERLERLAGQAARLSAALQKLQAVLGDGGGPAGEQDVAAAANAVEAVLERCQAAVDEVTAEVDAARGELPRLEARVLGWLLLGAVAVTAAGSWAAVSQVGMFAYGLRWFRGA